MDSIDDFFIEENRVGFISEDDYKRADIVISAIKAFARLTYQSIYIIDYYKKNFLYVSDNPLFLCGLSAQEVKELGYAFYAQHVPEEEVDMLLEINQAGFKLFNKTPAENRLKMIMSYDFHIQYKDKKTLINHKLTPILLSGDGNIWLAACVVSQSSQKEAGNVEARMDGSAEYRTYSLKNRSWTKEKVITLNERERDILLLSSQGFSMNEIAKALCITKSTVKFHKNKLFERLNVKKISEALTVVNNSKLI